MSQGCSRHALIETLEYRRLLSMAAPSDAGSQHLTRVDVERILGRAGSQAMDTQIIAVVDCEGNVLGVYGGKEARDIDRRSDRRDGLEIPAPNLVNAIARARTAAFFASTQNAFTTRTARFIIQDHFPPSLPNTPGGPLYGVEFSSLPGSDVFPGPAISGDPGGVPLFKSGIPVGGIGVAGDGQDIAARATLLATSPYKDNPQRRFFNGTEESDFDERVALAGARQMMALLELQADQIFVGGIRLPFTLDRPATGKPQRTLAELITSGAGTLR